MPTIYKKYGKIIEITKIEKKPLKIRVHTARERRTLYGKRRPDNLRRTGQICVRRVLAAIEDFGRPLLVTLTFAGDASDAAFASDSLRTFQVRLRSQFPNAQSLFIPELSPKGRIHFHGLLFNVPLPLGDTRQGRRTIALGDERRTRLLARIWGEGYVDAVQTDGSPALAYYISKYINKGAGETLFNAMRILRISHGFPREITIRGALAEELGRRYEKAPPFKEWSRKNIFLGRIEKKFYEKT